MASIDTDTGRSGKKAVDANVPLIPFIDLLLCCVMFLLVTAVWNQLASIDASQEVPGERTADQMPPDAIRLQVQLNDGGYVVTTTAGDSIEIPKIGGDLDIPGLCERLDVYRRAYPDQRAIAVAPDDGIAFDAVVATMDAVRSRGFSAISL